MKYQTSRLNSYSKDEVKVAVISDEMRASEQQPTWQILVGASLAGLIVLRALWIG
ncbi:MAG: hypothetical protein AAGF01_32230 [Cyanobacteria bacterium P01_G01_bin.38]